MARAACKAGLAGAARPSVATCLVRRATVNPSAAGRHPDYHVNDVKKGSTEVDVTSDERYQRSDFGTVLAHRARMGFAKAIQGGEPKMRVAEAALWASAEDDALSSHSTVEFPVASYLERITQVTDHVHNQLGRAGLLYSPQQAPMPEAVLQVVEAALFEEPPARVTPVQAQQKANVASWSFKAPEHGRSALPWKGAVVDHAGTWEQARDAYLHEVLVRRTGHPAALACIYAQVMWELLARGSVNFAVSMDIGTYDDPPSGVVVPGITRDRLSNVRPAAWASSRLKGKAGMEHLNTCTSDVLAELQRHLKRSYWPWAWDTSIDSYDNGGNNSLGGFRAAAKAGLGEEMNAAIAAISQVAAWRLDRGIWTSPGAGDLVRARAACERLVLLRGEETPVERRDLAVVLLHIGEVGAARTELRTYMATRHFKNEADPFDKGLCHRLMDLLNSAGKNVQEPHGPLTLSRMLATPEPSEDRARKLPLTW